MSRTHVWLGFHALLCTEVLGAHTQLILLPLETLGLPFLPFPGEQHWDTNFLCALEWVELLHCLILQLHGCLWPPKPMGDVN